MAITAKRTFQVDINNGEIKNLSSTQISISPTLKNTILCQHCQELYIFNKRSKILRCSQCEMILCQKCVHTRTYYHIHRKHWCPTCSKKLDTGEITEKMNKDALKVLKKQIKICKQSKIDIKK